MSEPSTKHNFDRLNDFVNTMEKFGRSYRVRIGVLGAGVARSSGGGSNAQILAAHEFGAYGKGIPMRSVLRNTLHVKQSEIISTTMRLSWKAVMHGDLKQLFEVLGVLCVRFMLEAFDSAGFGSWAPLKLKTIRYKIGRNPQPLVNTGQMRGAISYDVKSKRS
jgi:hypothetical protein